MTDRYVVIGNPVAHSKSPAIHALFAAQTGQFIEYGRLLVSHGEFASMVEQLRYSGAKGANVTLPFKEEAFSLSNEVTDRAGAARAVNTMSFSEKGIRGDNTDGYGLVRDLTLNQGFAIGRRRVLLLGAGGAARGVVGPLLEERPSELTIANRTVDKARALAELFGGHPLGASACGFADLAGRSFDLVINATSAGLSDTPLPLPARLFATGSLAYDMVYGRQTPFMRQALAGGATRTADGLGMLVEQAAESFFVWRGVRPQTAPVIAALRSA